MTVHFGDWTCATTSRRHDRILLGHGGGGRLSADLLEQLILPAFGNDVLDRLEDQAVLRFDGPGPILNTAEPGRLAISTDAFVVRPIFFPGGDIGCLAVHGTLNDLAVGGAEPRYLTVSLILEEGLPMADLERVLQSLGRAAKAEGVQVIAGDTKVVERGNCDQIYITTTGIGYVPPGRSLSCHAAQSGDHVIASGTIGDHGVAIMSVREGLEFETILKSDTACLSGLTRQMLEVCPNIRCMRDPTRGGVASALNEIARASQAGFLLFESKLVVRPEVRAACEMLGLDPLYMPCEGRLLAIVPAADSNNLLDAMRNHPLGRDASVIGEVLNNHPGTVALKSAFGRERVIPMLSGEQLPRIC